MSEVLTQPRALITCCWGAEGLAALAPTVAAIVIVDVLRFTTCVSVAGNRGAVILPYQWQDDTVDDYALRHGALIAGKRGDASAQWSLSPTDLLSIPAGTRLVLPSPNGSALSFRAVRFGTEVIAGCLRNVAAVADVLASLVIAGKRVAVIAAGERWANESARVSDAALRPALEDMLGAGAIIAATVAVARLDQALVSAEARAAAAVFRDVDSNLESTLMQCSSGQELLERGWLDDVVTAAALNADDCVPVLRGHAYVARLEAR